MVVLGVVALIVAAGALGIAMGVSLGRNSDRMNEQEFRDQLSEHLGLMNNRITALEPGPEEDDDDSP